MARVSHYDAVELRRHLGLSAEQFETLGDALFGLPAQEWLDAIRLWDAAFLLWEGRSRSEIALDLSISNGAISWTWSDDFVDFIGCRPGQVIRIHSKPFDDSGEDPRTLCRLALPENLELPAAWAPGLHKPSAVCHRRNGPSAGECPPTERCLRAGACLYPEDFAGRRVRARGACQAPTE